MRKLSSVLLIAAALGVSAVHAQPAAAPAAQPTVKAIQPGLYEVAAPRANEAISAGIQKISATPGKGGKSIEVRSPWGNIYFDFPKNVKPVAFTIEHAKQANTVNVSAPGFTEANKSDYKAAIEAVVPLAISKAQSQKETRTKG